MVKSYHSPIFGFGVTLSGGLFSSYYGALLFLIFLDIGFCRAVRFVVFPEALYTKSEMNDITIRDNIIPSFSVK